MLNPIHRRLVPLPFNISFNPSILLAKFLADVSANLLQILPPGGLYRCIDSSLFYAHPTDISINFDLTILATFIQIEAS